MSVWEAVAIGAGAGVVVLMIGLIAFLVWVEPRIPGGPEDD